MRITIRILAIIYLIIIIRWVYKNIHFYDEVKLEKNDYPIIMDNVFSDKSVILEYKLGWAYCMNNYKYIKEGKFYYLNKKFVMPDTYYRYVIPYAEFSKSPPEPPFIYFSLGFKNCMNLLTYKILSLHPNSKFMTTSTERERTLEDIKELIKRGFDDPTEYMSLFIQDEPVD